MKEDFLIKIETWHKPDLGTQENVSSTSQEPQGLQASEQGPKALPCSFTIPTLGPLCAHLFPGQEGNSLCLDLSC